MPDIAKLILSSDHNAFKNESVQRSFLPLPTSIPAATRVVNTITFTLSEAANFIVPCVFATDYGDYFNYGDGKYHDAWRPINNSIATSSGDYLLLSSAGLINFAMRISIKDNIVTATLTVRNLGASTITINHPTYQVPITFVEYTLDK